MRYFLFILCFFMMSMAHKSPTTTPSTPKPSPSPTVSSSPVPVPSGIPTLVMGVLSGAINNEPAMVAQGFIYANIALASPCFKNLVLNGSYAEVGSDSPSTIWAKMVKKSPVKVNVSLYTGNFTDNYINKTIGYENEPGTVYMNRFFVDSAYMVGDNAEHEGMGHSIGYTHYVDATLLQSEPYQMNHFYEKCAPSLGIK